MHVVVAGKVLREFVKQHADAETSLKAWRKLAENGDFRNLAELKQTFPSVDMVPVKKRDFYVFNIGGNKYRLVVAIHFNAQKLFVRHILTHAEYDTDKWKMKP
jgi:mRNA interferase HigB